MSALRALGVACLAIWVVLLRGIGIIGCANARTSAINNFNRLDASHWSRRLFDTAESAASAAASITTVTTASQLQAAVVARAQDIELRDHVDLTGLSLVSNFNLSYFGSALGAIQETRSIRGNCTSPPPALSELGLSGSAPALQWNSPQCVIVTDHATFSVFGKVWLDALYIRAKPSIYFRYVAIAVGDNADVYATRLTLQGDSSWNTSGVWAQQGSQVYIQDSIILDTGGNNQVVDAAQASVVLNRTTFTNCVQRPSEVNFQPLAAGGPNAGQYKADGFLTARGPNSLLLVQGSVFNNVTASNVFWVEESGFIAAGGNTGAPDAVFSLDAGAQGPLRALGPVPSGRVPPLGPADQWWMNVQQSLAAADSSSYVTEAWPPGVPPVPPAPVSGTAPPQIAAVYSAEDFQRAFHNGVRDIELRGHIDMQTMETRPSVWALGRLNLRLGAVPETTRSIRGNCTSPPPPGLDPESRVTILTPEPWQAPRCVIFVTENSFLASEAHVWMDSLHIQVIDDITLTALPVSFIHSSALFMTNTVVQGETAATPVGLQLHSSHHGGYIAGCVFNSLRGDRNSGVAIHVFFAPAFFDSCAFRSLSVPSGPEPLAAGELVPGAIGSVGLNATLALQNCTLEAIQPDAAIVMWDNDIYSDNPQQTGVLAAKREVRAPRPLSRLASRPARAGTPLSATDPWFVALQETLAAPPASAYLEEYPPPPSVRNPGGEGGATAPVPGEGPGVPEGPSGGGAEAPTAELMSEVGGGMPTAAIAGSAVGAVALVAAAIGLFSAKKRRDRRREASSGKAGLTAGIASDAGTLASKASSMQPDHESHLSYAGAPHPLAAHTGHPAGRDPYQHGFSAAATAPQTAAASALKARVPSVAASEGPTITAITNLTWSDYQKAGDGAESPSDALEIALDAMCNLQAHFHGRYLLQSAVHRRVGGQGLVQFATIAHSQEQAAIKFYLDRKAFESERELYTESQLKAMMPATLAVEDNATGACQTPYGYAFPPFVIIERGESLDEWARDNANQDFVTIFQVLSHAVRALKRLHKVGYAHRDIKPGNILRRPKQHDWTLIDFGCTARIGSTTGLSYSLKYAAPEVVHALEAGSRTIHVDPAVDIWAIGVIAYELLTEERAFPMFSLGGPESDTAARDAIAGRVPLPWEGESQTTRQRLAKLRGMRRTVLRCLARDPADRPTADALLRSWDHKFDNMHTRGTALPSTT